MFSPNYTGPMNADTPWAQPVPMNYVQGSINPTQQMYTPQMTQILANQQRQNIAQQFNPLQLAKQFGGTGTSRSASTAARLNPLMAQGIAARAAVGPNQQFNDMAANKQMYLKGQQAQDAEGAQWADIMARLQDSQWQHQMNQFQNIFGLMMGQV